MRIEHIALWSRDIERLRAFYAEYFGAVSNEKYVNAAKSFESYFLTFAGGARLEIMSAPGLADRSGQADDSAAGIGVVERRFIGPAHFAVSVGSEETVDELTRRLSADGHPVVGEPRRTGDGYYESVVLDPDGNRIEITV